MPVKTASWRQRSEPPYRRPTMTLQMSLKPPTPHDQRMNPKLSLSRTARDPSPLTAQTAKRQRHTKREVLQANTQRVLRSPLPSVYILIVPLPPTENPRTKRTITATKKRRAKRTTWSPQLLVHFLLLLKQTLEEITAPHKPKAPERPTSSVRRATRTVLMTMV